MNMRFVKLFTTLLLVIVVIGGVYMSSALSASSLMIAEVCSENATVKHSPIGDYADFITLHNPSNEAISLIGYQLSDSQSNLSKYVFTRGEIAPGEDLTVWAEKSQGLEPYLSDDCLYLDFRLSAQEGETVFLSDPSGCVIDKVVVPACNKDQVYRKDLYSGTWQMMPRGEEGLTEGIEDRCNKSPSITPASGHYDETVEVTINAPEGYTAFYTLDGSEPSSESLLYDKPFIIEDISLQENRYASISGVSLLRLRLM